jgi:sulfite reductase (NADPH) flavoprotein alpha-component
MDRILSTIIILIFQLASRGSFWTYLILESWSRGREMKQCLVFESTFFLSSGDISQGMESSVYDKNNPFPAVITENRLLNRDGSIKETRHFIVKIEGSGLSYTVGDSLGIYSENEPGAVEEILTLLGFSGEEPVSIPKFNGTLSAREALSTKLSLAGATKKLLVFLLEKVTDEDQKVHLESLVSPESRDEMMKYLANREFIDVLEEHPSANLTAQELVNQMRRLMPRLYSIASSPLLYPNEIHLTIAVVRYETNNRERIGVCSTFVSDRVELAKTKFPVFVASSHFALPEDGSKDVIMIGPGTGIAPFRAFLQERDANKSAGRNWLFFGDQHRATDYLYGEEFQAYSKKGLLTRIDLAFSRDQEHKIYVQDRIRENGAELWDWIKSGAHFYVCGDAKRMAKDVDAALHEAIAKFGEMEEAEAIDYVKSMKKEKRYQRDVY